jgi:hypothetical protein
MKPLRCGVAAASSAATAAASCRSDTKNYTANLEDLRSLPSKFQVNRPKIAAVSATQTKTQTHKHTKCNSSRK